MFRLLSVAFGMLLVAITGCQDSTAQRPAVDATQFVTGLAVTSGEGTPLGELLTVQAGQDAVLRLELEPLNVLPDRLDGRPVRLPHQWDLALWMGDDLDHQPPRFFCHFTEYRQHSPRNVGPGTAVLTGPSGTVVSTPLSIVPPPASAKPGWIYRYARLPLGLPAGEYQTRLLLFPAADPPPEPGLQVGTRTLGMPIVLMTFKLQVVPPKLQVDPPQ